MELKLYPLLRTCSRRAITRTHYKPSRKHQPGDKYHYCPRIDLLERLSRETGMNISEVAEQLMKERNYLLSLEGK